MQEEVGDEGVQEEEIEEEKGMKNGSRCKKSRKKRGKKRCKKSWKKRGKKGMIST